MPSAPPPPPPIEASDWIDLTWSDDDGGKEEKQPAGGEREATRRRSTRDWDEDDRAWGHLSEKRPAVDSRHHTLEDRTWGHAGEKQAAADSCHQTLPDWEWEETTAPVLTTFQDGRFVRFSLRRTVFELTAKYKAPVGFLGGGAYGTVCHAFDSEKGKQMAIKKITNAFADDNKAKMALREVMLLCHMKHANVIGIVDIIPPADRGMFNDVYITTERVPNDMRRVICLNKLSAESCKSYVFQLLCGLKYLHSRNVIHRDLKPGNLLLTEAGVVKICDFGQARTIPGYRRMSNRVGTFYYKAPELLLHSSAYDTAIDVWSVGCILVEFITRKPLFTGRNEETQLSLIFGLIGAPNEDADLSFLDNTSVVCTISHGPKQSLSTIHNGPKQSLTGMLQGGKLACDLADKMLTFDPRRRISKSRIDVRTICPGPKRCLTEMLPNDNQLACDLAEKMLIFDPRRRITIEDAMAHPYFEGLLDANNYEVSPVPSFEEHRLSIEEIKEIIYKEALSFNPEFSS